MNKEQQQEADKAMHDKITNEVGLSDVGRFIIAEKYADYKSEKLKRAIIDKDELMIELLSALNLFRKAQFQFFLDDETKTEINAVLIKIKKHYDDELLEMSSVHKNKNSAASQDDNKSDFNDEITRKP